MLASEELKFFPLVIFCNTIKCANHLVDTLQKLEYTAECFHSDISLDLREKHLFDFINGNIKILLTCRSYGMGIDNPVVHAVIHYDMPSSMAEFMQRTSLAGRNEENGECYVFLDKVQCLFDMQNKLCKI